jgi:hypothetical protein
MPSQEDNAGGDEADSEREQKKPDQRCGRPNFLPDTPITPPRR